METIILERHKTGTYTVNHENKSYIWAGSKGNIVNKRTVSMDVYDYLSMFTSCFTNGELVISDSNDKEKVEELLDNMYGREEYKINALTKTQVIEMFKGTVKQIEKKLNQITSETTKMFILDVAKEIGLDNFNKQKLLRDWLGCTISVEELFELD